MNRRHMLASLVVSLFAPAINAIANIKHVKVRPVPLMIHKTSKFIEVRGNPDDVREFAYMFQDNLWPKWRNYPDHSEKIMRTIEQCLIRDGLVFLAQGPIEYNRAYVFTLLDYKKPIVYI